ncbi:MAG TPA: hypothetical protein PLI10_00895 [Bacillota bacterium]|nr:hypothetical protein [Bacillota bacterium]HOH09905.1 hypothetical protein [Bacillota bacterium]HOS49960.1 hypothetical protein [Bacillota bacterium]HOY88201.1 hypothetical protein [Bacillota bacterium]HPI01813.1 hypothetical protein [Bacillota bacterium]
MVYIIYRLLFLYITVFLAIGLFKAKTLYERLTFAFVAIPFALRALNIK